MKFLANPLLTLTVLSGLASAQLDLTPLPSIDVSGLQIDTITGMDVDPNTGSIWFTSGVPNSSTPTPSSIFELDPATGAVLTSYETASVFPAMNSGPDGLAINPVTGDLHLFQAFIFSVSGVVAQDGSLVTQYLPSVKATGATFNGDGELLAWDENLLSGSVNLVTLDETTGGVVSQVPWFSGVRASGLAFDPITGHPWILAEQPDQLIELDPDTLAVLSTLDLTPLLGDPGLPGGLAFSPDGTRLYLSKGSASPLAEIRVFERAVAVAPYGCSVNLEGSLAVLAGSPTIGTTLDLGIADPSGNVAPGSVAVLALSPSPDPAFPCGTVVPGWGLAAGAPGEVLVSVVNPFVAVGSAYGGSGSPSQVPLAVPNNPALAGLDYFAQGLLIDLGQPVGEEFGLTNGLRLTIGG